MHRNHRIAVVIPAYCEEKSIGQVIMGLPEWVDQIVVVDDASTDQTATAVSQIADPRVVLIRHTHNQGVGSATITGFKKALDMRGDILIKMDGDGQMDPRHILNLLDPLVDGIADYSKGNRFRSVEMLREMPFVRLLGNAALTFMVKLASGYWHIFDPQNGFVAIRSEIARKIHWDQLDHRYFFEDDTLINLNIIEARVIDIPMASRYCASHSSLHPYQILFTHPPRLLCGFFKRIWLRYVLYDFSPIALLLCLGFPLTFFGGIWGAVAWLKSILSGHVATTGTVMLSVLPILMGIQFLLSALQLDIQNSPRPTSKGT